MTSRSTRKSTSSLGLADGPLPSNGPVGEPVQFGPGAALASHLVRPAPKKARKDKRHLWPEFARLIRACEPPVVFGEQVASKLGRDWLGGVFADLEGMGYRTAGADLCAAGVGAPHIRQRLWWLGHASGAGTGRHAGAVSGTETSSAGEGQSVGDIPNSAFLAGADGRVADAQDENRRAGICATEAGARAEAKRRRRSRISGADDRMGDAERDGSASGNTEQEPRQIGDAKVSDYGGSGVGDWALATRIQCADGKTRRIEPGITALVDGVPGRVGLLRGYGNAIVPQVAQAFIKSYLEAV